MVDVKWREKIFETASWKRGGDRVQITRFYSNMSQCRFDVVTPSAGETLVESKTV